MNVENAKPGLTQEQIKAGKLMVTVREIKQSGIHFTVRLYFLAGTLGVHPINSPFV